MMSDEMREAIKGVFDYLDSLSEEELLDAMNSHQKTEWYPIFKELWGDMPMEEWLEMQKPKSMDRFELGDEYLEEGADHLAYEINDLDEGHKAKIVVYKDYELAYAIIDLLNKYFIEDK